MTEQTIERLRSMRLHGMLQAFESSLTAEGSRHMSPDELLDHLVQAEWDDRTNRKQQRTVKNARFRYKATIEQISFDGTRQHHRFQILRLAECGFI